MQLLRGRLASTVAQAAAAQAQLVWAGDLNFVEDLALDSTSGEGGRRWDREAAEACRATAPSMVDSHRHLHPSSSNYTRLYRASIKGASRLDRIYVSSTLPSHVFSGPYDPVRPPPGLRAPPSQDPPPRRAGLAACPAPARSAPRPVGRDARVGGAGGGTGPGSVEEAPEQLVSCWSAFLQSMFRFANASGQRLNVDKVELLQVGASLPALPTAGRAGPALPPRPPQQPGAVAGMRVVKVATALNIPISNSAALAQLDWDKLLGPVRQRMQRLARMQLSTFGRAAAVSAYCLQMVTWHMH